MAKAKADNNIKLLHQIFTNNSDFAKVDEAISFFNQLLQNAYEEAIKNVYIEKNILPLENYITGFSIYEKHEIENIKEAKEKIKYFKLDIKAFEDTRQKGKLQDFDAYINNYPKGIFLADAKQEIENLKKKSEEVQLYKHCIDKEEIRDLRRFKIYFPNSEYFKEVSVLLSKKETIINAQQLFEEIGELIKSDNRQNAILKIEEYQANCQGQIYDKMIQGYKDKLELWDKEDEAIKEILNTKNIIEQKRKCHEFLGNKNYQRRNEEVDKILNPKPKIILSAPMPTIDRNLKTFPLKEFRYWASLGIIILLTILIVVLRNS